MILSQLKARAWDAILRDPAILWGLVVAAVVRLVLLPWFSDPLNYYGFELTGSFLTSGRNPWMQIAEDPALARLNPWGYPPAFLIPTIFASAMSMGDGYMFGIWIRLPLILCDLAAGVFLFRLCAAKGLSLPTSRVVSLGYLFNPFVVLVSVVWGTNDPYAVLCVAGALYFLVREPRRVYLAATLLGLGMCFKVYPAVIVPLGAAALSGWALRARFIGVAATAAALPTLPLLIFSPREFLVTLGAFTTGVGGGGVDYHLGLWWVVHGVTGAANATVVAAAFAIYGLAVLFLAWCVARGRVSLVLASTLAVIGLFVVAPRFNQNYYLWAVWLLAASAAVEHWSAIGRRAGEWSWLPLTLGAVFYNGASGVTGTSYWALISTGLLYQPFRVLPTDSLLVYQAVFYVFVGLTIATLWRSRKRPQTEPPPEPLWPIPRAARSLASKRVRALIAVAVAVFVVSTAAMAAYHFPVTADELGEYQVTPARTTVVDEFRSRLVGFTWSIGGNGHFELLPGDGGHLRLDGERPGGTAHASRLVPQRPVHIAVEVTVEKLYGDPGFAQVIRVAQGWVGVMERVFPSGARDLAVVYVDDQEERFTTLGTTALGVPLTVEAHLLMDSVRVDFGSQFAIGASGGFVRNIHVGMVENVTGGGASLLFHRVQIDWPEDVDPMGLPVAVAIAVSTSFVMALPLAIWWRRP